MAITASMVKELREMTGAGMMDCKKALNETNGDMDAAVEFLRKNGQAKAEKKASRIAAEGVARAAISADGKTACVIEVNSETDFVAKNETFTSFVEAVNAAALASDLQGGKDGEDIEALLAVPFEGATVKDALVEKTATIGEKLSIRRFEKVAGDVAVSYIHGGGRIGVIVAANGASDDAAREALTNIAMQVAALNPKFIAVENVPEEYLAKEREILTQMTMNDEKNAKKPANIIEKMIEGRLNKEMKEVCLVEQPYVKDGDLTVKKYIESVAKEVGAPITIRRMVRFETGEGLEKKQENFAEEVAKAAQ